MSSKSKKSSKHKVSKKAAKNEPREIERKPILSEEEKAELANYNFSFDNLALEGGGVKGNAYVGTIRVLEEIGVYQNIKRFAGTSAGSIVAMWAALGYDSYDIERMMSFDQESLTLDAKYGIVSYLSNIRKKYGFHPGKKLLNWFGEAVEEKLGDPDATFADLYAKTGRELCVVVVSVNQMDCVYCHVKTTPDMPIRLATRMSASIPGVMAPVQYTLHGVEEMFCDGGLICNYPVHAFDGWYLSMKPEDNFLRRIPDLHDVASAWDNSSKFGTKPNPKTIGMLLYSEAEQEMFKVQLIERLEKYVPKPNQLPDTKLARERGIAKEQMAEAAEKHKTVVEALNNFLQLLSNNDVDDSGTVSRDELRSALESESSFTKEQQDLLFGKDMSVDELFDSIDTDGDGELTVPELTQYAETQGWELRTMFRGFESRKIKNVGGFFDAVIETLLLNMKRIFMKGSDIERTIGIDTGYLDTLDFAMEDADKMYLKLQGKNACIAYLRYYIDSQKGSDTQTKDAEKTPKENETPGSPTENGIPVSPTEYGIPGSPKENGTSVSPPGSPKEPVSP